MDVMNYNLYDMSSRWLAGNPTPVLQENHNYAYMTFSSGLGSRWPILCVFDKAEKDGQSGYPRKSFIVRAGDKIPVRNSSGKGREVYLFPLDVMSENSAGDQDDTSTAAPAIAKIQDVTVDVFLLSDAEAATITGPSYRQGEKIANINSRFGAAEFSAGDDHEILTNDQFASFGIDQCFLHLRVTGGGMSGGTITTTYPLELVFAESDEEGHYIYRTFLFPGASCNAELIIPIAQHHGMPQSDASASPRWKLSIVDPTGNTGVHGALHVRGALIAGSARCSADYSVSCARTAVAADGVVSQQLFHAFTLTGAHTPSSLLTEVLNLAAVAAMDIRFCEYIPTKRGGPARLQQGTLAPIAGGAASGAFNPRGDHFFLEGKWAALGTGLGYWLFQRAGSNA